MEALCPHFTSKVEPCLSFLLCGTLLSSPKSPVRAAGEPSISRAEIKMLFQGLNTALSQLNHVALLLAMDLCIWKVTYF